MVILAEGDRHTLSDLSPNLFSPNSIKPEQHFETNKKEELSQPTFSCKSLQDIERAEIEAALRRNGWVKVRAARELGLTERQIGYLLKKFGFNRYDSFR